jgi:hypothetical protein
MTKSLKTLLMALALSTYGSTALAHAEHGQPQHGGVVAEAGEMQFEVVGKDGLLTVHLSNHGSPVPAAGATGKLTALVGTAKSEFDLKAAGDSHLQGSGSIPAGAKLLISVQWPGKKPLQARAVMR